MNPFLVLTHRISLEYEALPTQLLTKRFHQTCGIIGCGHCDEIRSCAFSINAKEAL
jgi:hypothetical protein